MKLAKVSMLLWIFIIGQILILVFQADYYALGETTFEFFLQAFVNVIFIRILFGIPI